MMEGEVNDLLGLFISRQGKEFSDDYLRDIIVNYTIAGRDTTAWGLSWCLYLLALHPEIQVCSSSSSSSSSSSGSSLSLLF